MDDTHLAVVHLIGHRGAAGAEHAAVEIAVIHTEHHAADVLVVVLARPHTGISALLHKWLQYIIMNVEF